MAEKNKIKEITNKLKDLKKQAIEEDISFIFVPTWKQIRAKLAIHNHLSQTGSEEKPSNLIYVKLEKISGTGKSTWQRWFEKQGFIAYLDEKDNFQEILDTGAIRMLKRLEELAFTEKGNSAVVAAKAYLALSSFAKQRVSMEISDVSLMSDEKLDQEIEELEKKYKLTAKGWKNKVTEVSKIN